MAHISSATSYASYTSSSSYTPSLPFLREELTKAEKRLEAALEKDCEEQLTKFFTEDGQQISWDGKNFIGEGCEIPEALTELLEKAYRDCSTFKSNSRGTLWSSNSSKEV